MSSAVDAQPMDLASLAQNLPTMEENSDLITSLVELSARSPKLVRSSVYKCPADESIEVCSWKMNEFKYYDIPSPFPTLARGLFSRVVGEIEVEVEGKTRKKKKHEIVIRGYDKFFNIDEVPWTSWSFLEDNTTSPYTLSLKSNGCIIFIAALTPSKLLVTSKHSLGPVSGVPRSHAQVGEAWLEKHLASKNKTKEQLARTLHDANWTAIAELCDDNFEEHVLGYSPEKTGLHLHGINARSKEFATQPTSVVDAFAEEWGFIKTPTVVLDTIKEVRDFTSECAKTGEWNGEPVEGFVVRTTVTGVPVSGRGSNRKGSGSDQTSNVNQAASPYKQGNSFFFKVKFDEPYMMYRDWREVTKMLLTAYKKNGRSGMSAKNLPKSKMKRPETKVYVKWVIEEIKKNPDGFEDYGKGKGIIKTRERFLEWLKTKDGVHELEETEKDGGDGAQAVVQNEDTKKFGKTIIVPVAIPGCGKTAVAVALTHIFGFGHTQSDDVKVKKPAPQFIKNVSNLLRDHNVVIADKNNHLKQHRQQLRDAVSSFSPLVRLLALNWAPKSHPPAMTHRICSDRIIQRGQNHQSLIPDSSAARAHEEVLWMFVNQSEELTLSEVDACIDMRLEDSLEESVKRAVKGISSILGLEEPEEDVILDAVEKVNAYEPGTKAKSAPVAAGPSSKKGKFEPRYFGLLPEIDLKECLNEKLERDAVGAEGFPVPDEITAFWKELKQLGRHIKRPHVTVVHSKNKDAEKDLWERCMKSHLSTRGSSYGEGSSKKASPLLFKGNLGTVLSDGRIMCVTIEGLEPAKEGSSGEEVVENDSGKEFLDLLPAEVRDRLHITIGTKADFVAPVEALALVKRWKANDRQGIWGVELPDSVEFVGMLKGLMG